MVLSVEAWQFSFIATTLNHNAFLILTWLLALSSFFLYKQSPKTTALYSRRYNKYLWWILLGVFISMFAAYYTWGQSYMVTLLAQRNVYCFILLPAILYAQPTERDIFKALRWMSYLIISVWILKHISTSYFYYEERIATYIEKTNKDEFTKLVYADGGIYFLIFYIYFLIHYNIKGITRIRTIEILLLIFFLLLFQNRSMLLGVIPAYLYSLFKFRSRYKFLIFLGLILFFVLFALSTSSQWMDMISNSQDELSNPDYNRWKALNYYLFLYSPNWFCYVFGNGFPSGGNSLLGNTMWTNFESGIYQSDLGLIGMWTMYGLIPMFAIYSVVIKVLRRKHFPNYLKFASFHILVIPTIFTFQETFGILFFVLYFYCFAYNNVKYEQERASISPPEALSTNKALNHL
jgi:hypothetical protein